MTNLRTIQRRLVNIEPLFKPTDSVWVLIHAVQFVNGQLSRKNVNISDSVRDKIQTVNEITDDTIFRSPSHTFDSIHGALAAIKAELPETQDSALVQVPETVDANRFVSSVINLANSLLSMTRFLDLLHVEKVD
ncbi:MAG: hypothetical protein K2Y39_27645 [Candidatus Obscuribacterales bacterium]|nr:hypothetical protein [Candidatus Obscuribacterales bacterium]